MHRLAAGFALLSCLAVLPPAAAQSLVGAREWLPTGSLSADMLLHRPQEALDGGERQNFYVELGRLAFRSPDILGGTARKAGLSCHACHSNGHDNPAFFIPGLSDAPGRVDVTHSFWNARGEDHRSNPLTIPSLRGVKTRDRLGHDQHGTGLREFTRRVIVVEFAGAEPSPLLLDALVAYLEALQPVGAEREAITIDRDLADIRRYLTALALPLAEEDVEVTATMAQMIRSQMGFVHERFAGDPLAGIRILLENWSRQLASIATMAEAGAWPAARDILAGLQADIVEQQPAFSEAETASLYDPQRLQAWLSTPIQ